MPVSRLHEVTLLGVPVELWRRSSSQQEAIQREFDIIRAGQPEHSIPNRLFRLLSEFDTRFGKASQPTWDRMLEAAAGGEESVDLTFTLPAEAAAAARQLGAMLDEVDSYCREGEHLLTLATPPDLAAFRGWFLGEFTRQIDHDLPPLAWEEPVSPRGLSGAQAASPPVGPGEPPTDTIVVQGDLDLATAGALRDDIQRRRGSGAKSLTIDLTGVGFMDSVGISLLVSTHQRLTEDGVQMRLAVPPRLQTLLDLCGLTDLLQPEVRAPGG